jgi:hypothetical protein
VKLFEQVLARQQQREADGALAEITERDWTREDLYDRGRAR